MATKNKGVTFPYWVQATIAAVMAAEAIASFIQYSHVRPPLVVLESTINLAIASVGVFIPFVARENPFWKSTVILRVILLIAFLAIAVLVVSAYTW